MIDFWTELHAINQSIEALFSVDHNAFSVLTLSVGQQEGHTACKKQSGAQCRLAYGPADATATHCLLLQ